MHTSLGTRRLLWNIGCWSICLVILLPVIAILGSLGQNSEGVWPHLVETVLAKYVFNSLMLVLGVGVAGLIIGVSTAWLVTAYEFPFVRCFRWAIILPLAIPTYLTAYALTDLFQFSGPVQTDLRQLFSWAKGDYWFPDLRTLYGAIIILTLGLYPYIFVAARSGFLTLSESIYESSRMLGLGPWQRFLRVAIPLCRPAIFAGLMLVLMETLAEFGAVEYCAVDTFSTGIYRTWTAHGSLAGAGQLSSCLLGFICLLFLVECIARRKSRFYNPTLRSQGIRPTPLTGWRSWLAVIWCASPIGLGFLLPASRFAWLTWQHADPRSLELFYELSKNSLLVALVAAGITLLVGLTLAFIRHESRGGVTNIPIFLCGLGYAVPGTIVAIGIMTPIWWFEDRVCDFTETRYDWSPGLFLSGTILAMLLGYLIRFLAVPLNFLQAGLGRIPPSVEDAAANLGAGKISRLVRVQIPLIRGTLVAAGLLVFVDVLKELPATLVLRPFNFETLAVRVYELASDERLSEASTSALSIIIVGIIPVVLLARIIDQQKQHHFDINPKI